MAAEITSITGLQNLSNLQNFYADWNGLSSVNLSNLPNLQYVDVSDNEVVGGEGENSLTSVNLSNSTNITELRLDDSDFSVNGTNSITGFSNLTSLNTLDLDGCGLTGTVDLSTFTSLGFVDLSSNSLENIIITGSSPINGFIGNNNDLTVSAVNNILIALDENGITGGSIEINGGTNATPQEDGITAAINLIGKSWFINTNDAPDFVQYNNRYDISDTGSICADTAGNQTFYASGSLGIGTQVYLYRWGGVEAPEGWYQNYSIMDPTLYFVSGGIITATGSCPA